jgi:hypothetical protein
MRGYVYVLTNRSMPNLIKIGKTGRHPKNRLDELHSTGVPEPFSLEYYAFVDEHDRIESRIHYIFQSKRHSKTREFFSVGVAEAILAIRSNSVIIEEMCFFKTKEEIEAESVRQRKQRELKEQREREERKQFEISTQKCSEFNNDVLKKRQEYIESNLDTASFTAAVIFISIFIVPAAFAYTSPLLGMLSLIIAVIIANSNHSSEKRRHREDSEKKFPFRTPKDFHHLSQNNDLASIPTSVKSENPVRHSGAKKAKLPYSFNRITLEEAKRSSLRIIDLNMKGRESLCPKCKAAVDLPALSLFKCVCPDCRETWIQQT